MHYNQAMIYLRTSSKLLSSFVIESYVLFADGEAIIANCEQKIDNTLRRLGEEYEKCGMHMNISKTEYLRIEERQKGIHLQLRQIRKVSEHKYVGSIILSEGTSNRDTEHRIKKCVRLVNLLHWSNQITH